MASVFTKIIRGDLPGRFVWRDDRAVAFLSINPIKPGHVLVVPIDEVDHWLDLDPGLNEHLMRVAQSVGRAIQRGFDPARVALMIAGLEVPHVHLHVFPVDALGDMSFANADPSPREGDLDAAAEAVRAGLRALGFAEVADASA